MTSTPFNVGLRDGQRNSSRVLRPPGGGHTQLFGEPEELQVPKHQEDLIYESIAEQPQQEQPHTEVNGAPKQEVKEDKIIDEAHPIVEVNKEQVAAPEVAPEAAPAPPTQDMPRRTRVPPGGFSSSLCMSESTSTGCSSTTNDEEDSVEISSTKAAEHPEPKPSTAQPPKAASEAQIDEYQLPSNIDLRYGGQYLTPDQLPEFCDQLHNLVDVIRNIQSYAKVTGEYPSELERRLEREAREVAALASEARNARDVVARTRAQRRALRSQKKHLVSHLTTLRETEVRELESTVRISDRKLYKNWESLKDSTDPAVFTPLLDEIKNKQSALECLVRLIESRKSAISRNAPPPTPLPPPLPHDTSEEPAIGVSGGRQRQESTRRMNKRRRKETAREPRSVPLSGENSRHEPQPQGSECTSRYRTGSAAAGALAPLEFSSHGSVRDILFFTSR